MQENSKQIYFASANMAHGFVSFFERCFMQERISRLYMIKGGPGTGKSRFIGDVATHAVKRGWHAEYYACSSDPDSLDGVILTHPRAGCIALVDATAPHVMEPTLPGVRDVIVNLGDFWDRERLAKDANRIRALNGDKQACYERSYAYLHAAGKLLVARDNLIAPCVDSGKLDKIAAKVSRLYPKGRDFDERLGLVDSVGMKGRVHLDTYEKAADRIVAISPFYGVEYMLMDALYALACDRGCAVRRALHVLLPEKTATLYFPDNRLCLTVGKAVSTACKDVRRVDLRHLCCAESLRSVRGEARLVHKLVKSSVDAAVDSFACAGEYHFELEGLYTAAMDFDAKERFTATFCNAILQNP